jgi:hypothetical protein
MLELYPHLSGIAISNGWAWRTTDLEEGWESPEGAVAMRRNLPGGAQREIILVPREVKDRWSAKWLADLYDKEGGWIDWALAQQGSASLNDLLLSPR